ncbi:hypothetical protein ACF1DV_25940 [Streptomyces achromogenes]|uniref:hypothetical protein n=1 Tax=Streptomyces achromogenes TaxID=67255 RepID=UPI0036F86858
MAVAEKTTVERVVTEDGFTLKLTVDEAETLVAVLARVGGSPHESPRGNAEAVMKALSGAGVRNYWVEDHPSDLASGSIQFADYGTES